MEPVEYLKVVGRRWMVIVALGIIGAAAAWAYASALPAQYRSTSSVFVSSQRGETTTELVQGSALSQNLVQSYAELATTPAVLDPVIKRLDLDLTAGQLAGTMTVRIPLNTVIIEISIENPSPAKAAEITDEVTASLASTVLSLAPKGANGSPSILLDTVSSAQVPTAPVSPNTALFLATGLLVGLGLGVLSALAREVLDTRVRAEKDLLRVTDVPLLGAVSHKSRRETPGLVMRSMPHSYLAEAYRRIRANLEFIDVDHQPRTMVITSPLTHDGKSTTAINLALALAERSPRVLLIDADLRRPAIAEMCGIDGDIGLTTVLVGTVTADEAIIRWDSLHVLPAGTVPPNPGQLLGSTTMSELIAALAPEYDFIVIDSPPLLPATDALGLVHLVDGAIVVARYKSTRRAALANTLEALDAVNARVLGIVLNAVRERRPEAYYGGTPAGRPRVNASAERPAEEATEHDSTPPLRTPAA